MDAPGAPKRPGGLGDLLAGALCTVAAWKADSLEACLAACVLTRISCRAAFAKKKRIILLRMIPFDQEFENLQARVIFNANRLHVVHPTAGERRRLSFGSFVGVSDEEVRIWS